MKLTFLGHASWLIQTPNAAVVCDLLVENRFRNGTFVICPTREFDYAAMPKLDALIITHRHRDHFDLETLVKLDRKTKVLCPQDQLILHALDRLGYENVERFANWSCHEVGDLEFIFTPSDNPVPENGFLATDGEVTFWNHVDTVINATTIGAIEERIGKLDFVAHGYQPMLETSSLESLGEQFPLWSYRALMERAKLIAPRALAPGSNGYRTAGNNAWFNAFKFPVSRERFIADIHKLLPDTKTFTPNPGDVVSLGEDGMHGQRQASENQFVRTPVDDAAELMAFDPSRCKPDLADDNPLGVPEAELRSMVRTLFEKRVPEGCKKVVPRLHLFRVMGASFEVRVVYPQGTVEPWVVEFSKESAAVSAGSHGDRSDFVMRIAASALHAYATGRTRSDIIGLSGQFRLFSRPYRIDGGRLVGPGMMAPPSFRPGAALPWLFFNILGYERDWESRQIDSEIDLLLGESEKVTAVPLWERPAPKPLPKTWARRAQPRPSGFGEPTEGNETDGATAESG